MLGQTTRGLELEKGNILTKLRAFMPLLLPLLITYLLMARTSAVILETRAFRYKNERTYMRSLTLSKTDYLLMVLALASTVLCAVFFWEYGSLLKIV
jgi:energy-coupling factor transport system permease protein